MKKSKYTRKYKSGYMSRLGSWSVSGSGFWFWSVSGSWSDCKAMPGYSRSGFKSASWSRSGGKNEEE